jgi:hypothetical protein
MSTARLASALLRVNQCSTTFPRPGESGAKNHPGTHRRDVRIALCTKEIGAAMSRTDQE